MHVGVCTLTLRIPENDNLKGKRRIVHSIVARVRSRYNVAIAEVGENDNWRTALLGVTCVSNDAKHADAMLAKVVRFVGEIGGDAELVDSHIEILDGM